MNDRPAILPGATVLPPMDRPRRRIQNNESADVPTRKNKRDQRLTRDRFAVLNAFVDGGMVSLSRAELATWLVLYRDTRNGTAKTGITDIARRLGTTRRTVVSAVGKLRRRGLLTLVYRGGLNRGVSIYHVNPLPNEPAHG